MCVESHIATAPFRSSEKLKKRTGPSCQCGKVRDSDASKAAVGVSGDWGLG